MTAPAMFVLSAAAVTRTEYMLLSVSDDGFASLLDAETGETRNDLTLPPTELSSSPADTERCAVCPSLCISSIQ